MYFHTFWAIFEYFWSSNPTPFQNLCEKPFTTAGIYERLKQDYGRTVPQNPVNVPFSQFHTIVQKVLRVRQSPSTSNIMFGMLVTITYVTIYHAIIFPITIYTSYLIYLSFINQMPLYPQIWDLGPLCKGAEFREYFRGSQTLTEYTTFSTKTNAYRTIEADAHQWFSHRKQVFSTF